MRFASLHTWAYTTHIVFVVYMHRMHIHRNQLGIIDQSKRNKNKFFFTENNGWNKQNNNLKCKQQADKQKSVDFCVCLRQSNFRGYLLSVQRWPEIAFESESQRERRIFHGRGI